MRISKFKKLSTLASTLALSIVLNACSSKEADRPAHLGALNIGKSDSQTLSELLVRPETNAIGSNDGLFAKSGISAVPYTPLSLSQIREKRFEFSNQIEELAASIVNDSSIGELATSAPEEARAQADIRAQQRIQMVSILRTVAPYVLQQKYVSDQRVAGSRAMADAKYLFYQALSVMTKQFSRDAATIYYLNLLEEQVFRYCDGELKGCANSGFYMTDNMAVAVMMAMADVQEERLLLARDHYEKVTNIVSKYEGNPVDCLTSFRDIRKDKKEELNCLHARSFAEKQYHKETNAFFRYFLIANQGLNRTQYLEYYLKYVKYSKDYNQWYQSLGTKEKSERKREYQTRLNFLGDALRTLKSAKSKEYCDYLIAAEPYAYYTKNDDENANTEIIIKDFISCAEQRGNIEEIISSYIETEKERITKEAEIAQAEVDLLGNTELIGIRDLSYHYALSIVKSQPHVMHNMGVSDLSEKDLAFYIIDGIFYERIDVALAREYFKRLKNVDEEKFLRFVHSYIKVQIAYLLQTTQKNVGRAIRIFYKKYKGLAGDLFQDVSDTLHTMSDSEWSILKNRISFINDFLIQVFDEKYGQGGLSSAHDQRISDAFKQLKTQLSREHLDTHFNYVVTMPLMLAMSYYMAKSENSIEVNVAWLPGLDQTLNLDGSNALSRFFDPHSAQILFFRYGTRYFKMDDFQKQQTLDLALRSGLFENVPFDIREEDQRLVAELKEKYPLIVNKDHPELANEYLLFERIFNDVLKFFKGAFRSQVIELDKLLQVQDHVGRFSMACENPYTAPMKYNVGDIYSNVLVGDTAFLDHMTGVYGRLNYIRYWNQEIRKVRDIVRIAFDFLDSDNVKLSPVKRAAKDQIKQAISDKLEEYEALPRQVMRRIQKIDRMIVDSQKDCLDRIRKAEDFRKERLYEANLEFYKDAHAGVSLFSLIPEDFKIETTETDPTLVLLAGRNILTQKINEWYARITDGLDSAAIAEIGYDDARERMLDIVAVLFNPDVTLNSKVSLFHAQEFSAENFAPWLHNAVSAFLGIHNHQPVYGITANGAKMEVGFYVTGTENFYEQKREIKRKNRVYKDRFLQSRWDTLVRIRRYLQTLEVNVADAEYAAGLISAEEYEARKESPETMPIAPDLYIPMMTIDELASDNLYKETKTSEVRLPEDYSQRAFVEEAMSQFAGDNRSGTQYVSWHSPSGSDLKFIPKRMNFLIRMFRLGAIEITEGPKSKCPLDKFGHRTRKNAEEGCELYQITAEDVMKYYLKFTEYFLLDEFDMEILNWINREGRLHEYVYKTFKLEDKEDPQDWTYFDKFYQTYFAKSWYVSYAGGKLTFSEDDRLDGSGFFSNIYRRSIERNFKAEHHLFDLNEDVIQVQRDRVRRPILDHMKNLEDIEEAIMDFEDSGENFGNIIFRRKDLNSPDSAFYHQPSGQIIEIVEGQSLPDNKTLWSFIPVRTRAEGHQPDRPNSLLYLKDDPESVKTGFYNNVRSFFIKEAACEALPREGDPDFDAIPESTQKILVNKEIDCDIRYTAWKDTIDQRRAKEREARRKSANGSIE